MLQVLYLVHDISDPAVRRRVSMLRAGGAKVTLAGFRRTPQPITDIDGLAPVDLGQTQDGRFAQRMAAVARAALSLPRKLRAVPSPDVIIARNMEMLVLARRARSAFSGRVPIVYECLDIHRLVLREDLVGQGLRLAERLLGHDIKLLITSSPAFIKHYFQRFGQIAAPIELVENKYFGNVADNGEAPAQQEAPPWRIGWFGALRCRRSLELLAEFSRRMGGRFEIVLRGRPALSEFADFHAFVEKQPHMSYSGSYRNPEDMAHIYGEVHFAWAIDFFEEGQNSKWLLPNRLYEGCRFGAVPIAMADTETARFLTERRVGIFLHEATPQALMQELGAMSEDRFARLRGAVANSGWKTWAYDTSDCRRLVARLGEMASATQSEALVAQC
jgi:succinoglycan biosynthesis protein ExoL